MPNDAMTVQSKDQPGGNDDRAQNENRKGKTAIRKELIEKVAEHLGSLLAVANYAYEPKPRLVSL